MMSAALALAVLAGGLTTYAQRREAGGDCRLHLTDVAEGPVSGWFEGGTGTGLHGVERDGDDLGRPDVGDDQRAGE